MIFKNRVDAAEQLVQYLSKYKNTDTVVLAIPRGGLPLGKVIAEALELPMDIVLSKKLSHPTQREYAIGAVSLHGRILSDMDEVSDRYIEEETARVRQVLTDRYKVYYKGRLPLSIYGKTVIIVDDGIATGLTLLSTIALVQQQRPSQIVVAVPVATTEGFQRIKLDPNVDDVICPHIPEDFRAVGQFYEDFRQVNDDEAVDLLRSISIDNLESTSNNSSD